MVIEVNAEPSRRKEKEHALVILILSIAPDESHHVTEQRAVLVLISSQDSQLFGSCCPVVHIHVEVLIDSATKEEQEIDSSFNGHESLYLSSKKGLITSRFPIVAGDHAVNHGGLSSTTSLFCVLLHDPRSCKLTPSFLPTLTEN